MDDIEKVGIAVAAWSAYRVSKDRGCTTAEAVSLAASYTMWSCIMVGFIPVTILGGGACFLLALPTDTEGFMMGWFLAAVAIVVAQALFVFMCVRAWKRARWGHTALQAPPSRVNPHW